jgi:hypothetical protein
MKDIQASTLDRAAPHRFDQIESGVRVVVSGALPVSAGKEFERWLVASVRDLRPPLKPFVPLVVAMMGGEDAPLAMAAGDAAIIVWCRRKLWYSGLHPEVTAGTLEHEAAHVLWIRIGSPGDANWEAVMRQDADDPDAALAACLLLPGIASEYERAEWIREDWAYSVECSRASAFTARFPARSRRIAELLPS